MKHYATTYDLLILINLRGQREQAFKFACARFKGGMKQCYTKGCEIFVPLRFALTGIDLSGAIHYENCKNGEI